jgi:predicted negative regulator of RcsB-dependent stress response
MGTLLILVLLAVAGWVVWKLYKKPDLNDDGKVDLQDIVVAAKEVAAEVKYEAAAVASDVKTQVAEAATKVNTKVKKIRKGKKKA